MTRAATDARGRLLVVTHAAPIPEADNAGQSFVHAQVAHWAEEWDVSCLMVDGRSARDEIDHSIVAASVIAEHPCRTRTFLATIDRLLRWSFSTPRRALRHDLWQDPDARTRIAAADVVVLQWEQLAMLAPTFRRINPRAIIVAVLHDVVSQSMDRYSRSRAGVVNRLKYRTAAVVARMNEARLGRLADRLLVLSAKDVALLPPGAQPRARVVPAPITFPDSTARMPVPGRILLVANWRDENRQGLGWFQSQVLPQLQVPGVEPDIHLIGPGLDPSEITDRRITVRGYVADLSHEYASAALVVVPLWEGAGVKFKTVEALAHGVPLVTTTVGAEGIEPLVGDPWVTDDANRFAELVGDILTDPAGAEERARSLSHHTRTAHAPAAFAAAMAAVLD